MKNNSSLTYNISLVVNDALAIIAAFAAAYVLRVTVDHRRLSAHVHALNYITIIISLLPFWLIIFALLGLYSRKVYDRRFGEMGRLTVGSVIGILAIISYSYLFNVTIFPARLVTIYAFALVLFFVLVFRTALRGVRRQLFRYGKGVTNVLIVGDTLATKRLINAMADTNATGQNVIGVVGGVKHPLKLTKNCHSYQTFASATQHLKEQPDSIIQTELYSDSIKNDEILSYAQENHIAYGFVPGNSELFVGNIEADLFHSIPIIAVHQTTLIGWGRVVKRLSDIFFSSIFIVLTSPIMLLSAIAIKLTDGGPVFFRHERLSRYNAKVRVFKFRTMKMSINGLEPEEAFKKLGRPDLIKPYRSSGDQLEHDPRITYIGRFLRLYSLDELPQMFNVFKGDISLVGPRALVAYELDQYPRKNLILNVKSGLTGLAQISGVKDLSFIERRRLDLYYVEHWSFWNDLVIIAKTFWVVLTHKGTRA